MAKRAARQEGRRRRTEEQRRLPGPAVPPTTPPQVPSPALEGLVQPGERSAAFAGLAGQQPTQNFAQRFANLFSGIRGPGYKFALTTPREGLGPLIPEIFQEAGREVVGSLRTALGGVVSGSAVLGGLFGERPQQVPGPAFISDLPDISTRAARPTGFIRAYWQTASSLTRGVKPRFITFLSQEALDIPEEWMEQHYVKVAGGWVKREDWNQPLENVYGSGTAAQPQTINVNYGGYGGGGGGTRQQSSYLVNWRI